MTVDREWRDAVRAACDPVFAAAEVGFEWNQSVDGPQDGLLLAARFAEILAIS